MTTETTTTTTATKKVPDLAKAYLDKIIECGSDLDKIREIVQSYAELKIGNAKRTFENHMTALNNLLKELPITEELKTEYNGHENHAALTNSYEITKVYPELHAKWLSQNNLEVPVLTTVETTETKKPKAKKGEAAPVLDASKLINQAINLLTSTQWQDIGMGISMLTGLRQADSYFYTKLEAENTNSMLITGISKKRGNKQFETFRIPVLHNSDEIEAAYERLRKMKPFHELHIIANEKGLIPAREQFNNDNSSTILKRFGETFKSLLPEGENDFHALRGCAASIWYHLMKDIRKCNGQDSTEFAKNALAHDTDGVVQRYLKINFENLPTLSEEVFKDMERYTEVENTTIPDKVIALNLSEIMRKLDVNSQADLAIMLQNSSIEDVLTNLISRGLYHIKMQESLGGNLKPNNTQKLSNVILAMMEYNYKQKESSNPRYIYISISQVQRMGQEILGKQPDRNTVKAAMDGFNKEIEACHTALGIEEKINLSLRGQDKIASVIDAVSSIYGKM